MIFFLPTKLEGQTKYVCNYLMGVVHVCVVMPVVGVVAVGVALMGVVSVNRSNYLVVSQRLLTYN